MFIFSPTNGVDDKGTSDLTPNFTNDLSAPLLQSLPACGKLWAFARMCDRAGRGYAEFTLEQAEQYLGLTRQSIRRYVRECLDLRLIRGYRCQGGTISFYYMSQVKAALMRGLESLGAIGRISIAELPHLKIVITEVQAEALQRASRFAKAKEDGIAIKDMPTADDLLTGPSEISQGALPLSIDKRYAFFDESVPVYGGSQETIGGLLGVSDRTVRKRLSDSYREKKGLDPVVKKQAAVRQDLAPKNWAKESRLAFDLRQTKQGHEDRRMMNVINPRRTELDPTGQPVKALDVFRRQCNIYALPVELRPKRFLRKAFKRISSCFGRPGHLDLSELEKNKQSKPQEGILERNKSINT